MSGWSHYEGEGLRRVGGVIMKGRVLGEWVESL